MRNENFRLRISKEQEKTILLRYPDIKFFLEKMISNTVEKIIIEGEQFNVEEELKGYHDRRVLNDYNPKKRKMTQATKDKISKALKAKGWKGIPLLEETKIKIGLAHKGKIVSKETREKISKANRGKKRTEEQRERISLGHRGIKRSEETKRRMSLARKGVKYKKA